MTTKGKSRKHRVYSCLPLRQKPFPSFNEAPSVSLLPRLPVSSNAFFISHFQIWGRKKKFKKPVSAGVEWLNGSAISREKKQSAFYPSLSGQPFLKVPSSINRENPYFFNVKNKSSCSWEEYLQSVKTWDVLHPGILWKYLDFFVSSEEENLLLHNLF